MTDSVQTGNRGNGRGGFDTTYLVWAVLAVPAVLLLANAAGYLIDYDLRGLKRSHFLRWSGIASSVFLIVTMMITPLSMLAGGGLRWLRAQRRYLGVASFGYAVLHLGFWLAWSSPRFILHSFVRPEIVTGWIGFFIMAAMAWTSTDGYVRRMGPRWKRLQRWVYPSAILIFLHWILTAESLQRYLEPIVLSAPLIALSVWRFGFRKKGRARP